MHVYEFHNQRSKRFWQIAVHGASHTVQYGRIGGAGRATTKDFKSPEAARNNAEKLVSAKLNQGYAELSRKGKLDIEPIYLVSNKTLPVAPAEIDALEHAIGSLPCGYREFLHRCGERGSLCDDITIYPPQAILESVEAKRQYMTFSHCVAATKDRKGLQKADFDDIWIFGGDGLGNNYCYFPQHPGSLFNLLHAGTRVVRHDRAFGEVSQFFYYGRIRHPFPFFTPRDDRTTRSIRSFRLNTSLQTLEIAKFIEQYWQEQGENVKLVQMPPQQKGDDSNDVYVFVKCIGAAFNVCRDEQNHPGQVLGGVDSDKEHRFAARKCLNALEKAVSKS